MNQRTYYTEPILEAQAVEIVYVLPADAAVTDTSARAPWVKDISALSSAAGYLARIAFFGIAPSFVALLYGLMGNLPSLTVLVLLTLLFASVIGRTPWLTEKWPWLLRVPLLRDALEVLNRLNAYYFNHRLRSFLFYVCYPISLPLYFVFSRSVRKELRLWMGIFGSVILALLAESRSC